MGTVEDFFRRPPPAFVASHPGQQGVVRGAPARVRPTSVLLRPQSRLPKVRKQYHFWPGPQGLDAWDVDRLIALTAGLPAEEVALRELPEIDSVYWFDQPPTVRNVVDHVRLIQEVDPAYPIILGPGNRVMDGMHRVARAMLEGKTTIRAVRLHELPDPDYRNCRPEDLPY